MAINKRITGKELYSWATDLFPICRSLTGPGVRKTLKYFKAIIPNLKIYEVPSGSKAFDWTVPDEWEIRDAYVTDENKRKVIDFKKNNLHIVGYSKSINKWMSLNELDRHLFSLPNQPDAIPYVTSYYKEDWGFCIEHNKRQSLKPGKYHVVIDSDLKPGILNYGELILPGRKKQEIFLSTYICHPSMANNELSGPVVTTALAKWLSSIDRRYTYRIVFIPETIGSIIYLSKHLKYLKKNVIAGFNITCVGDNRCYSYLASRNGDTLSDHIAKHVLNYISSDYKRYSFLNRGSDERQYCAPGVDLPICLMMRSKFAEYPEYHTSKDNLHFISPKGLEGGLSMLRKAIEALEKNGRFKTTVLGEPQLGRRGLYPPQNTNKTREQVRLVTDFIAYCDGYNTLLEIANIINVPIWDLYSIAEKLVKSNLLKDLDGIYK